jgi:hypothetical protein
MGITAFREFLYTLYDKIAADKNKIDMETIEGFDPDAEDSVHSCFPVFNELAIVLFNLGHHGRLETEAEYTLGVTGSDLLTLSKPKNEKFQSFITMKAKRKSGLFNLLSELGFIFDGLDFSKEMDFSKVDSFTVKHDNSSLIVGLKLIAEAQAKADMKISHYHYTAILLRGDFTPLSDKNKSRNVNIYGDIKDLNFDMYLNPHPPEIKEWVINIDKELTDRGCKVLGRINNDWSVSFSYIPKGCKKGVCSIIIGVEGCMAAPYGTHFRNEDNMLSRLPDYMIEAMSDYKYECTGCGERRPDLRTECHTHYTHKGKSYRRCNRYGFDFSLNKAEERDLLKQWIMMELAYRQ